MSKFQAIENGLISINGTVFQQLCDSYLKLKNNNYLAFSRTGSQSGKQKTTKGTPDSFFLLPSGNFLFIEVTTDKSTKDKLANDIKACFNPKKSKIPLNKIEEIVLCFNWNIDQKEILKLNTLAKGFNINVKVRYLMLDELAMELHLNHRDLANEYLGLPLDTGQIISMGSFIIEYNKASNGLSTPLDNDFLHREVELKLLQESINLNDLIILTGAPGIGKTKLALEGIKSFLQDNLNYEAFCISYKNHILIDDLYLYFKSDKDYILFVDDANRIDAFNQVIGFYKAQRKGKLKIVITVRDYAFQEVGALCQDYSPKRIDLETLSDDQIIDIIKSMPFNIKNSSYHKKIIRIADGNPRLAIMTSLLAKAKENIYALNDVSDLFENYFSTFVKDNREFAKTLNIKCIGLIAFFHTIPFKNREITVNLLNDFEIEYTEFLDVIDTLDRLELVEVQFDNVKIPEQNLSTYFFYKAFIKESLLSFETLLEKYFENNSQRFKDCVIPANNTFGANNVMEKLQPFLQKYWLTIKSDENSAFVFLNTFWYYLRDETLDFLYILIRSIDENSNNEYKVTYENNAFTYNNNRVIELLGNFFQHSNSKLKDSIELSFEYARKKPEHLPELIHKISEKLTFDIEDERYNPSRQEILFDILIKGLNNKDLLLSVSFYELSKTFLTYHFNHTEGGRNLTIRWYSYPISNSPRIQIFRRNIWETVEKNWNYYPSNSFDLLKSYSDVSPDVTKEIMEYDSPFLIRIIEEFLNPMSFEHCKYVQEHIRWFKRNLVVHSSFNSLSMKFTNQVYEDYLKLGWDRIRDKEMYEFHDVNEYETLKEAEIRSSFVLKNNLEIEEFYKNFVFLRKSEINSWKFRNSLDLVIDENCNIDFNLGCGILYEVIKDNNQADYTPNIIFRNHLNTTEKTHAIWGILQERDFYMKSHWELSFYYNLDESFINEEYVESLIKTITNMTESVTIFFDSLKRYLTIEPTLFQTILSTIYDRNNRKDIQLHVRSDFFCTHFEKLGNDLTLIKNSYLQQCGIQSHFDYGGKGFLNVLKEDMNFLFEYVDCFFTNKEFVNSMNQMSFSFIWKVEGIESGLNRVFDFVIQNEKSYSISNHFCNTFFRELEGEAVKRAYDFLILYITNNYLSSIKMNLVIDITRNSLKDKFDEILLTFISLNQDRKLFSEIMWIDHIRSYSGDVIISDIIMADWMNIQYIIERSNIGIELIPIKTYVNCQIENCKLDGKRERQRRFIRNF